MENKSNEKGRKYTVYEIEKLTHGKLTKYKLTKAILANELQAESVKQKKRGRGIPNYFIYESDLNVYLKKIEESKKHFIEIPEDAIFSNTKEESNSSGLETLLERSTQKIEEKLRKIDESNETIIPLLEKHQSFIDNEKEKSSKRRELIMELINMPSFMVKKRNDVLQELNKIS
ncbi:hypothetical protein DID78_06065 [Candidatus Marinamargulisbacteria bacterium SCGC AG-343-D04]|nr:hypothetical protein DID78_06065 [Candidatus Marinamargulisbacteria bacterium SCGC AG-343-D04]